MRRPVLLLVSVAATAVSGCGGDDRRFTTTAAANDPATVTCRGFRTPEKETCEGAYFQCRQDTAEIVDDIDAGRDPDARTISVRYARSYLEGWDAGARKAARVGCRSGLRP